MIYRMDRIRRMVLVLSLLSISHPIARRMLLHAFAFTHLCAYSTGRAYAQRVKTIPMPEPHAVILRHRRRYQIGLIGLSVCVTLGLLLAACPLSIIAVQQRVIEPPRFAVR